MRSPRILYVTPYLSGVPTSATELRTAHIARALQAVGELEVIAVDDDSESEANSRGPVPRRRAHRHRDTRESGIEQSQVAA
jgi:hypothetical protein